MSKPIIHGLALSSFVRTARMACVEKGIEYEHDPALPHSPEQEQRHPWGKVPAMTHGDVVLYETTAITRYIDEAFEGPPLQPDDALGRARMEQWISVYCDNVYGPLIGTIVIQRVLVPQQGGTPDEARIEAARPKAERALRVLDEALAESPFLAGERLCLADLFVFPAIDALSLVPEGPGLLRNLEALQRWHQAIAGRDSARQTSPGH